MAYYQNHLLNTYLKWKQDPKDDKEAIMVIDSFISKKLRNMAVKPYDYILEEEDDLRQTLRLKVWKAFVNIDLEKNGITENELKTFQGQDKANKCIVRYLQATLNGAVCREIKVTGIHLDKRKTKLPKDQAFSCFNIEDISTLFNDETMKNIATLLVQGEDKSTIQNKLGLTYPVLTNYINKMKVILTNE